ncbi:MAG: alkaline phosphatase D family protein [Sphingomonadaceae bacterium]
MGEIKREIRHGINRRTLLGGAFLSAGLLTGPAIARRKRIEDAASEAFTHGIATGEPGQTRMLFWTRYAGTGGQPVRLRLELSTRPDMSRSREMAEAIADPQRDWTARTIVEGLEPGTTYYYRFSGPDRSHSAVGRTRTLPRDIPQSFRIGLAAGASVAAGWFNGFAHAADADDVDLFLLAGNPGQLFPRIAQPVRAAPMQPPATLEEYWAAWRVARADPDLLRLQAQVPLVPMWDPYDAAASGWMGMQPARGLPDVQAALARRAFQDWLPVADTSFMRFDIGRLASLYRLDTGARDMPLSLMAAMQSANPQAAMARLRDEQWVSGSRQMLGHDQERWLFGAMQDSTRRGIRWQILAQQPMMGNLLPPPAGMLPGQATAESDRFLRTITAAGSARLPFCMAAWDGYPAARARLLAMAQRTGGDLVVLSADTHNSWAHDLLNNGRPAGVGLGCPSISAPGLDASLAAQPADMIAGALVGGNPGLRWADLRRRGYMHLTLTPAQVLAEWRFTAPVSARSEKLETIMRARVQALQRRLVMG